MLRKEQVEKQTFHVMHLQRSLQKSHNQVCLCLAASFTCCPSRLPIAAAHRGCLLQLPIMDAHSCPLLLPIAAAHRRSIAAAHCCCPLMLPILAAHCSCPLLLPTAAARCGCPLLLPFAAGLCCCPLLLPSIAVYRSCPLLLPMELPFAAAHPGRTLLPPIVPPCCCCPLSSALSMQHGVGNKCEAAFVSKAAWCFGSHIHSLCYNS